MKSLNYGDSIGRMSKESVLIVEDEFTKEIGLKQLLENEGFNTTSAASGDALKRAREEKPSVIVTDIHGSNDGAKAKFLEGMVRAEELKDSCIFILTESLEISLEIELRKLKLSHYFLTGPESGTVIVTELKKFFSGEEDSVLEIMKMLEENKVYEDTASMPAAAYTEEALDDDTDNDLASIIDEIEFSENEDEKHAEDKSYSQGEKLFKSGKFREAVAKLTLVKDDPAVGIKSTLLLGICHRNLKDYKNAVVTLQAGKNKTKNKSEKLEFYYQLGVSLQEIGKHKAALQFFGKIFRMNKSLHDTTKRIKHIMNLMKGAN